MKNQQGRKEDIEQFCHDFLKEKKKSHLHDVIDNYRHLFDQIDIQQLNLTQETFGSSFNRICRKLFDTRPAADRSYMISLLGFALTLQEYQLSYHYSWYHIEMLIDSLTDILTGVGFQPKELIDETITHCMIL